MTREQIIDAMRDSTTCLRQSLAAFRATEDEHSDVGNESRLLDLDNATLDIADTIEALVP